MIGVGAVHNDWRGQFFSEILPCVLEQRAEGIQTAGAACYQQNGTVQVPKACYVLTTAMGAAE